MTSAHAGMTATRLRRGILATAAAALLAVTTLVAAPSARAATPDPTPTLSGDVTVTLAPLGNGVVHAGESLSATVTIENGTAATVPAGTATMSVAAAPLADRGQLTAWLAGTGAGSDGTAIATADLADVVSADTEGASFLVPATDPALAGRAAGVYPLWVDVAGHAARSVIVVPAATTSTVGVVVPITAGAQQQGLLSAADLEILTGPDGDLALQLDAVSATPAILAVDPAIPAAIRALGTRAPATAVTWLEQLETLPNTRFALQFGDAEVSAQLAAGLTSPLQPTSLISALDAADFPTVTPSPTATPSDDSTPVPAVPDLATLLDIGPAATTAYWPSAGSTSPARVATLSASAPGSLTLVSSDATVPGEGGGTVAARGITPEGAEVLVYDAAISAALRSAADEADASLRGDALATASAYLSFASADAGGRPLLVVVERGEDRTRAGLRAAITAVTTADGATAVDLPTLSAAAPAPVTLTEGAVDPAMTAAVTTLLSDADSIARFATILSDPNLLTGAERASALQLLGAAWLSDPTGWEAAMTAHAEQTAQTLSAVTIVQPTSINLLTAGTNLKFWIHNSLPYPATVVLYASPDDLRLTIDPETTVTVAAADSSGASNTPVDIPVRARIANGEVRIALSLRSPTMEPIGTDQVVDVNVRADWENVGLALLVLLAGGFLTIGVIRTIRRRRARHAAADTGTDTETDTDADATAGADADPGTAPAESRDHPDAETPQDRG